MTLIDIGSIRSPEPPAAARRPTTSFVSRPGMTERIFVVLTAFVILHELPNTWFTSATGGIEKAGNPILFVVELSLIGFALLRIAGSFEPVYQALRLEPAIPMLVLLASASSFWSANLYLTAKDSVVLAAVALYGVYLILRFALNEILRLFALSFVAGTVLNLVFVLALPQYSKTVFGWDGVYTQKNALGFTAVVAIPILLTAAREHRTLRSVYYLAAIGQFVLLIGSESKTMLLATLCTVGLMSVYRGFRAKKTLRGAVIFGLVSTSTLSVTFATANIAILADILDKDVTLTGRTLLWADLWPIFLDRPILGWGYRAAFDGYFSPVHEVWIQNQWEPTHAHNAALQTGLDLGIVGILILGFLLARTISRATRAVRDVPGSVGIWPLAFMSTALLISISESGVLSNNMAWLLTVIAAISVSSHERSRRSEASDTPAST